ncbi:unnamed protein product [Penicillium olsonii]|nr:unnamed protein product [Penicillium olsonii]
MTDHGLMLIDFPKSFVRFPVQDIFCRDIRLTLASALETVERK